MIFSLDAQAKGYTSNHFPFEFSAGSATSEHGAQVHICSYTCGTEWYTVQPISSPYPTRTTTMTLTTTPSTPMPDADAID